MIFYVTFRLSSPLRNAFVKLESMRDYENAHNVAKQLWPNDYSMVYSEDKWVDYQGLPQDKRFNLREITTW